MTSPIPGKFEIFLSRIKSPALLAVAQHWSEARGKKRMPSWTDLSSSTLLANDKRLWCYAYDPKTGHFTGRLSGGRTAKWVGSDVYGVHLKDLHAPANYEEVLQLLTKIVVRPLASRTSGRLFTVDSYIVSGERIALPLAEDGRTGDGILGASDYEPPPLLGSLKLIHENVEWYAI